LSLQRKSQAERPNPQRQGAIAARRGPRESGVQQVCEPHFHPQWMTEIGAGAMWPWLGGSFATSMNQCELGDGDHEVDGEKWRRHEKC
jgi:hypothetical protein